MQPDRVLLDYVVDMAEIPTEQDTLGGRVDAGATVTAADEAAYRTRRCTQLAAGLSLRVDGRRLPLVLDRSALRFPKGIAGLVTLRLTCRLHADAAVTARTAVGYASSNFSDRTGWREVVAQGDGTTLASSDVPTASTSRVLTAYPTDLLRSPLEVRSAAVTARPGGPTVADPLAGTDAALAEQRRGNDGVSQWFSDFVSRRHLTPGFGLLALAVAVVAGCLHAFAPGHGKTVMAAFLVSRRGSLRGVSLIGLTVTATHTLGVLLLGVVLTAATSFAPERLYPYLGVASGLLLAGIGAGLLRSALDRYRATHAAAEHEHPHEHPPEHEHPHEHGHEHPHEHGHEHPHEHGHEHPHEPSHEQERDPVRALVAGSTPSTTAVLARRSPTAEPHRHGGGRLHSHAPLPDPGPGGQVGTRSLLAMGLAGGLVPSPSALVVLLGAIALHRAWFGVLLVLGYGAGMASTLVGVGMLLAHGRDRLERGGVRQRLRVLAAVRVLPVLTASVIVVVGVVIAARAGLKIQL